MKLYPGHQHQWTDASDLECGEVYYGHVNRGEYSGMDWSVPRHCNKPSGHKGGHWWDRDKPEPNPDLVACTVCGFQAPRNAAGLDGTPAPDARCRLRWQRLGDPHLHRCEFIGNHAPPHRCRDCGSETYRKPALPDDAHEWGLDDWRAWDASHPQPEQETR